MPYIYTIGTATFVQSTLYGMNSGTDFTCKGSCCACYSFFYNVTDIYVEGDVPVWDAIFDGFLRLEINWNLFTGHRYDVSHLTPIGPTITK